MYNEQRPAEAQMLNEPPVIQFTGIFIFISHRKTQMRMLLASCAATKMNVTRAGFRFELKQQAVSEAKL